MINFFKDFDSELIDRVEREPAWYRMWYVPEKKVDNEKKDKIYRDDAVNMISILAAKMDEDGKAIAKQFVDAIMMLRSAG